MNHELLAPMPLYKEKDAVPFFTRGTVILTLLMLNGIGFALYRFIYGIGTITNLDNLYPWGLWIGVDVVSGVALAAGGFTTAALAYIFHRKRYHVLVRPALLSALLGYTFVAISLLVDLGRYYNIWHPLMPGMWQGNSPLFEVAMCVVAYLVVLYIEFIPVVIARFPQGFTFTSTMNFLNNPSKILLHFLSKLLSPIMFIFIIAGVIISCLHQSSLGTVVVAIGSKIHPLWQTPILPLLFLLSAMAVGFPMVILESILTSRAFRLQPETDVLSKLAKIIPITLGIYLAFRIGDMAIRESYVYLKVINTRTIMFLIEIILGGIVPFCLLLIRSVRRSPAALLTASALAIGGVLLNRVNTYIVAYTPPYADHTYFPSPGEFSVTIGLIATLILVYRALIMIFPVVSIPVYATGNNSHSTKRGKQQ
jgi:Ni/Fe-hydrogenase subunit HybB-like protein